MTEVFDYHNGFAHCVLPATAAPYVTSPHRHPHPVGHTAETADHCWMQVLCPPCPHLMQNTALLLTCVRQTAHSSR